MAPRPKFPSDKQDQFMLRLPDGMRERIKKAADRSGRSMNAEIVAALETYYPAEPTVEELLDRVHDAIAMAENADSMPYRKVLIRALDDLAERVSSGLEFDQYRRPHIGDAYERANRWADRHRRWKRVKDVGVEQADLERELARGMLHQSRGDTVRMALKLFEQGNPERALRLFRLHEIKFAEPEKAHRAIEADLKAFYQDNWGDLSTPPPWEDDDE